MILSFLKKFFTTAPLVFPLIALFHIVLTVSEAFNYFGDTSVYLLYSLRPVVLLLYTVFWIGCCYLKQWAALGYLFLTMANLSLYYFCPDCILKDAIGDLLFIPIPVNILFCFLILFYYKRMQGPKEAKPQRDRLSAENNTKS